MESLARVGTEGVEPTYHSLEHAGPLREDVPRSAAGGAPADGSGCGPAGPFVVPRVIS
jgi:Asp-tRNA(Asn)/Glu-tRNA(Gln) amidotransferase C subunit